jgi:hypothetical protein
MTTTKETPDTQHEPFDTPVLWREVIRRHDRQGGHFFDDDTMSFFNSRLCGTPVVDSGGCAYGVVSSKQPPTGQPGHRTEHPRRYQVIRVHPDGSLERPHPGSTPHGEFALRFTDREKALDAADMCADPARGFADQFRWY